VNSVAVMSVVKEKKVMMVRNEKKAGSVTSGFDILDDFLSGKLTQEKFHKRVCKEKNKRNNQGVNH